MRDVLDRYAPWQWQDSTVPGGLTLAGGLNVTVWPVSAKAPKFAPASSTDARWVTALRIEDQVTGGVLVYAPCLALWPTGFDDLLASAHCVLLDGTFFSAEELGSAIHSPQTYSAQSLMGHLPVTGHGGTLDVLARHRGLRRIYTHLNNTNPLLDPASEASALVERAGVEVLPDGAELTV